MNEVDGSCIDFDSMSLRQIEEYLRGLDCMPVSQVEPIVRRYLAIVCGTSNGLPPGDIPLAYVQVVKVLFCRCLQLEGLLDQADRGMEELCSSNFGMASIDSANLSI